MKTTNAHMLCSLFELGYEQDDFTKLEDRLLYHFSKKNVSITLELPITGSVHIWSDENLGVTDVKIKGGNAESYVKWQEDNEEYFKKWKTNVFMDFALSKSVREKLANMEKESVMEAER
jgi:hypothetical protein